MGSDQNHHTNHGGQPEVPGPTGQTPQVDCLAPQTQSRKWSKLALASLMFGLGTLLVFTWLALSGIATEFFGPCILGAGIMAITGVCFGIAALWQIKRSRKRLRGVVLAIGGMVISCGVLALLALVVQWEVGVHMRSVVRAEINSLQAVARLYADEHDGKLPDPAHWKEELTSYLGGKPEEVFRCGFMLSGRGFAMNQSLVDSPWGRNYDLLVENAADPSRTVMFFEAKLDKPAGGPELLPEEPAYGNSYVIGFLDGRVRFVYKDQLDELIWTPQSKQEEN